MTSAVHSFDIGSIPPKRDVDLRKDFAMPLIVIGMLVVLAVTACIHFGVKALNDQSAAREQQLIQNGLGLRVSEVAALVVPLVDWDEAVRNLDKVYDANWADANINEFLDHTYGFHAQYIVDGNGAPLFAAIGERSDVRLYQRVEPYARNLVAAVRKMERDRGPVARSASPDPITSPIQASAVKQIDWTLTIVTATLVQPDFGTSMPSWPGAPIVVTEMQIDTPFLAQFSKRFLLEDVSVRLPAQPAVSGRIEVPVTDEMGKLQAYLTWTPLDPGYGMLQSMAKMVLLGLLPLIGLAALELRRIFRAAKRLLNQGRPQSAAGSAGPNLSPSCTADPRSKFAEGDLNPSITWQISNMVLPRTPKQQSQT